MNLTMESIMEEHAEAQVWAESFLKSVVSGRSLPPPTAEQLASLPQWNWPWVLFLETLVAQFVINWAIRILLVTPIARAMLRSRARRSEKVLPSTVDKFAQSSMEFFWYGSYFVLGARIILQQPWLWPSRQWWMDQPNNRAITQDVAFFYVIYASRYASGFITVFLETRRKDFLEMVIHHSVTVILVYLSFQHGMVRVGCVIMVLLDIADIPLHAAKQCLYMAEAGPPATSTLSWNFFADMFFITFAIVFTITRMGMYGYVTWSCFAELWLEFAPPGTPITLETYREHVPLMVICCEWLVVVLQILQVFWFGLILKGALKLLGGGPIKDNRSDSESGLEDEDEPKKKR
ncbi:Ceramide synthase 6 [Hondaea fermentalgiana]|uniref:Ceramide synthase 6 n=1 Tax=Hondaea fermentalgiana TaxID=2315210 RepID=A0A2R5GCG4_9STRA|nr:Ceramide synthase 6 [Hondaea fermentalgiana]|eukprot:GBG28039.1 Ceramide synthase 6 [Hondaea fermentalgiana]